MYDKHLNNEDNFSFLLEKFNKRETIAFGDIYSLLYTDLHRYTKFLYGSININSEDTIHDIFLDLWERKEVLFDSIFKLKGYLVIAIKNQYYKWLKHKKYEDNHFVKTIENPLVDYDIIEFEYYSIINEALNVLPDESAKILKMYLDGYKPNEIAVNLNKNIQTIYNKKNEAIDILRKRINRSTFSLLMSFL